MKYPFDFTIKFRSLSCLILLSAFLLTGCGAQVKTPVSGNDFILNTNCSITIYAMETADDSEKLSGTAAFEEEAALRIEEGFDLCRDYEMVFSRTNPNAELYLLNHRCAKAPKPPAAAEDSMGPDGSALTGEVAAGIDSSESFIISQPLYDLISFGLPWCEVSGGAFDITIAPLSDLWNFSASDPSVPSSDDILKACAKVNYKNISVSASDDPAGQYILTFSSPDTQIDLGSLAKGYIADRLSDYLKENGVTSAVINLGGNIVCIGEKPSEKNGNLGKLLGSDDTKKDSEPFHIGVQDPLSSATGSVMTLSLSDCAVSTSGINQRNFTQDGIFYHHLLDPATGYPIENGLASVTIISSSSAKADALSTVCFCLGQKEGIALLDSIPDSEGVFINSEGEITTSAPRE